MYLFVVGDVHGCYHTWQALLRHWNPTEDILIQVGDMVDRGRFSAHCVQLARELEAQHPGRTIFLLGNHEHAMLRHLGPKGPFPAWLGWGGRETMDSYDGQKQLLREHQEWISQRPIIWENTHVLISHAGFADTPDPLDRDNPDGVLWRRGPLLDVGKRQIIGHTPSDDGKIKYDAAADAIYLDTGAYAGRALTALRLALTGEMVDQYAEPTVALDIA